MFLDFGGRWKVLHYYAKNFFSPILVCGALTKTSLLQVFVASDLHQDLTNAVLQVTLHNFRTFTNITDIKTTIDIVS